ncbi:MAG TPA: hypothetical protein PKV72_05560 [Candidatus Peribacteria bacterium]|nr:hypothetical protein [Candidatus Peribacteria bacterium]
MDDPVLPPAGTPEAPATPEAVPAPANDGLQSAADERMSIDNAKKSTDREREMRKVAEVGQKRFQREANIKKRLKDEAASRDKRWQAAANEAALKKEEKKEAATGYRKSYRQREKEIAEDKKRKEKIRLEMEAKEKAKAEERKKQAKYMNELHEQARIKGDQERKKLQAEEEHDRLTREAQRKFRTRIEELDHEFSAEIERASIATQARKVVIQNAAQKKYYSLESWHRMRVTTLDSEIRNKLSAAGVGVNAIQAEERRNDIKAQSRNKYHAIEKEFQERQAEIAMDTQREKAGADNDLRILRLRAEENLRLQKRKAEVDLGRTLEDIATSEKKKPSRP